jgi:glycosyltransferase involved in cell wall biosynthesis
MTHNPLVSVVIPTFNRAGLICRTIDNVFEQTYRNLEVVVVDDGSTDDTLSRLYQYGDRIRVVTQSNAGPAVARNHGARVSRGEIIAFQDSDDLWRPTKLDRQVALLKTDSSIPCCLCNVLLRVVGGKQVTSFDVSLIHPRHEEGIWLNVPEVLATRFVLFNQAVAIRREAWERVGGFDESLKYLEDYDLPLQLALEGPWAFIQEPLVIYSSNSPESFSQAALKDPIVLKHCELKICERMLAKDDKQGQQSSFRRHLKRRKGSFQRELRAIELSRKDFRGARIISSVLMKAERYFLAGFRRSPWFPKPVTTPPRGLEARTKDRLSSSIPTGN